MFSNRIDGSGLRRGGLGCAMARYALSFCLTIGLVAGWCLSTTRPAQAKTFLDGGPGCGAPARISSEVTPNHPFEVIARYPHDQSAFTQGLTFYHGNLYESTGIHRQSSLRQLDLESGKVLKIRRLSNDMFGEGLAAVNNQLVQLTWQSGSAFTYSPSDLRQTGGFNIGGEGWGVTVEDKYLVISDGSSWLRFLDTSHYQQKFTLQVKEHGRPVEGLNELETVRGLIYANIYPGDCIAQIDPQSGQVLGWIDLKGLMPWTERKNHTAVANGIAYNPETGKLFVTGKLWPYIYQLKLLKKVALPDKQTALPATTG